MGKKFTFAVVGAACFLAYPSAAPARIVLKRNYDQLLKEADLVVLAVAVQTEQAEDEPRSTHGRASSSRRTRHSRCAER